jgi:hypothetical protein
MKDRAGCKTTMGGIKIPCYCQDAVKTFGLTDNYEESGWILPDGTMLDWVDRFKLKGGEIKSANKEHAYIADVVPHENDKSEREPITLETKFMDECNAIRFKAQGSFWLETIQKPTPQQVKTLKRIIRERKQIIEPGDEDFVAIRSNTTLDFLKFYRQEVCDYTQKDNYGEQDVNQFLWKCWK